MSTATTREGIEQVSAYVDAPTRRRLEDEKDRRNRSMSYLLNEIIQEWLSKHGGSVTPSFPNPTRRSPGKEMRRSR